MTKKDFLELVIPKQKQVKIIISSTVTSTMSDNLYRKMSDHITTSLDSVIKNEIGLFCIKHDLLCIKGRYHCESDHN